jgi:4-aminobutyrate aminotransferase
MAEEQLPARAQVLGDRLVAHLHTAKAANACIGDVRALGAMVACDFVNPQTGAPDADKAKQVQQAALKKGLLLLTCGVYGNVLRFLFPLTIEDAVFDEGLDILAQVLA